jgi:hypothetical protein
VQLNLAKKMLGRGNDISDIMEDTGLSREEIEELAKSK